MNFKNKGQVTNIRTQEVIKKIEIGNKECTIRIQDAYAGILNEEEIVLDEELINEMIHNIAKEIRRTHSKYNPIPEEITILHKKLKNQQESENERQELSERIVECKEPRFTFHQVILNETVRKQINTTISAVINRKRLCED